MPLRRRANLAEPQTIFEAEERLTYVNAEITMIRSTLELDYRLDHEGVRMPAEQYDIWRKRTRDAMHWFIREQAVLERYLARYQKELQNELAHEQARAKAERIARSEQRAIEKAGMSAEQLAAHLELRLALEREKRENADAARQRAKDDQRQASERKRKRRQAHLALQTQIAQAGVDDVVDPHDMTNLLRHTTRLLASLGRSQRVEYTNEERALIDVCIEVLQYPDEHRNNET